MKAIDLAGRRYGTLTVLSRVEPRPVRQSFRWLCKCDCGVVKEVPYSSLSTGHSKSCGVSCELKVHRLRGSPTYNSWRKMLARAEYKYYDQWYDDVTVCDRWVPSRGGSFDNFVEDMGEKPAGTSLNRVNGAKEYNKENCEWATLSVQSFDQKLSSDNTSGRTGVKFRKDRKKWVSEIKVEKELIQLYYGDSFEEACKMREEAELKYYGFTKE